MLKEQRERRRLSLETLSERTGISVARISNFESAAKTPYLDDLFKLAGAFRMRASTLARRFDPDSGRAPAARRAARP